MGLYIFITEQDRTAKRQIEDKEVNTEFQEALKYDSSLMIEQYKIRLKTGFLRYEEKTLFNIYHESPALDGSPYQARFQHSASGKKSSVIAYLHGIINGALASIKNNNR